MTSKMTKLSDYSKTFQNIDNKKLDKLEEVIDITQWRKISKLI